MKYLEKLHFLYIITYNILLFSSVLLTGNLYAEERLPELKKGMSFIEVVKLWGSPQDKIEKEVKRKDIWVYKGNSRVIFDNGTLVSVINSDGLDILTPENAARLKQEEKAKIAQTAVTPVTNQDVVDDILSEIMKDPSNSEPGDGKSTGQLGISPVAPNVQPNMINQIPPPEAVN